MVSYCLILQMKINGPLLTVILIVTCRLSYRWVSSKEKSFTSYSLRWDLEDHFFPFCVRGSSNSSSCASLLFQWCCADWGACSFSFIRLETSSPVNWTGPNYRLQHWHTLSPAISHWLIHIILKLCKIALCQGMTECCLGDRLRQKWFLVDVLEGRKRWVLEYRYPFCSTIAIMALIF